MNQKLARKNDMASYSKILACSALHRASNSHEGKRKRNSVRRQAPISFFIHHSWSRQQGRACCRNRFWCLLHVAVAKQHTAVCLTHWTALHMRHDDSHTRNELGQHKQRTYLPVDMSVMSILSMKPTQEHNNHMRVHLTHHTEQHRVVQRQQAYERKHHGAQPKS